MVELTIKGKKVMMPTLKEQIIGLLKNPIFLSVIFSWFGAQFIKTAINLIYGKIHSFYDLIANMLWKTGGMPSSHSALVISLCTTIGFKNGFNSDIFVLSLCFCGVVIRDAFGVRLSSGKQVQKLNLVGKELSEKNVIGEYKPLKEVNGHTPIEVLCGCIMGFFVGLSFSIL